MAREKELIEFKLDDDSGIVFESEADWSSGIDRIANTSHAEPTVAEEKFNSVVQRIRPAAQMVLDSLRELNTPSEIQLEFGLKFSTQAGVIIASVDSAVNFKVNLKWVKPKSE